MKVTVTEFQRLQGKELVKGAYASKIEMTDEERNILDELTEAEDYVTGKQDAILYANSYYGAEKWSVQSDKVVEQYTDYIVNEYTKEFDVNAISDMDMNDYIWPIVKEKIPEVKLPWMK